MARRSLSRTPDTWDILILTVSERAGKLQNLLEVLLPQVAQYDDVNVVVLSDLKHYEVGKKRTELVNMSTAEYICFIDDDDQVSPDYVSSIYPHLDGKTDYVGFKQRYQLDGVMQEKYAVHDARHNDWFDNGNWHRHILHINPIKRDIANKVPFVGQFGEDATWSKMIKAKGLVEEPVFIDKFLYIYQHSTTESLTRMYA